MKGKSSKHLKHFEATKLQEGETVSLHLDGWMGKMMGSGSDAQKNGNLIITNQRVCFLKKGILGEVFEYIPLSKISSIESKSMLGHRILCIHTSHDDLEFKTFEEASLFETARRALEPQSLPAQTAQQNAPSPTAADIPAQISSLADLLDQGILSEAEFEAKKTELLAKM